MRGANYACQTEEINRLKGVIEDLRTELRRAQRFVSRNAVNDAETSPQPAHSGGGAVSTTNPHYDTTGGVCTPARHTRSNYRLRSSKSRHNHSHQQNVTPPPQKSSAYESLPRDDSRPVPDTRPVLCGSVSSSTSSSSTEGDTFGGGGGGGGIGRYQPGGSPSTSTTATVIEEDDIDIDRGGGIFKNEENMVKRSKNGRNSRKASRSSSSRRRSSPSASESASRQRQRSLTRPNPVRSLSSLLPKIDAEHEPDENFPGKPNVNGGCGGQRAASSSKGPHELEFFPHSRCSTADIPYSPSQSSSSIFPPLVANGLRPEVTPPLSSYDSGDTCADMSSGNVGRQNLHRNEHNDGDHSADERHSGADNAQTSSSPEALGMSSGSLMTSSSGESVFGNSSLRSLLHIEPPIEFDTDMSGSSVAEKEHNGHSDGSALLSGSSGGGMDSSASASSPTGSGTSASLGDEFRRPRLAAPSASSMLAALPPEPPSSPLRGPVPETTTSAPQETSVSLEQRSSRSSSRKNSPTSPHAPSLGTSCCVRLFGRQFAAPVSPLFRRRCLRHRFRSEDRRSAINDSESRPREVGVLARRRSSS